MPFIASPFAHPEYIDLYCERTDLGFWNEPINALTNLSFIFAAIAVALLIRQNRDTLTFSAVFLTVCLTMIGIGSFLFHTFANQTTFYLDVVPIFIYQLTFLGFYTKNIARKSWLIVSIVVLAYWGLSILISKLPDHFNGSMTYAAALFVLSAIAVYHVTYIKHERYSMLIAVAIFSISLALRSIDMKICAAFPFGTHFMWHLLNGIMLYFTLRAYILNLNRPN